MESGKRTLDFKTALFQLKSIHGLHMNEQDFEEVGFMAWKKIGNREVCTYLMKDVEPDDTGCIELPCNADYIEAVTRDWDNCDRDAFANMSVSTWSDHYINRMSAKADQQYKKEAVGEYIPYTREDNTIIVDPKLDEVNILYVGLRIDEDGLPKINDKESLAIAWYCAYIMQHRKLLAGVLKDAGSIQYLKAESDRHMRDARVPERLSQNLLDAALNVKTTMSRKWYNKSYKLYRNV